MHRTLGAKVAHELETYLHEHPLIEEPLLDSIGRPGARAISDKELAAAVKTVNQKMGHRQT